VLGLAAAAERRGVRIVESTPVTGIGAHAVDTPHGAVRARWIVRATEGYTAAIPGAHRELVPLNSAMIVTEPLPTEVWSQIGWDSCATMLDAAHSYRYLQRTADSRIAIGGRGRPYRLGSRTDAAGEIPDATARDLRAHLVQLFPSTVEARIERGWTGVLGVPRDWCSSVGADTATGLCWAGGYAGDGVSTANLAGRTLRDLILGHDTELTRLPWVGRRSRSWEPEPLRWLGINAVFAALRWADAAERRTGRPSRIARLAGFVSGR
jgi:glycine/D-amino acid oxidase-like deaminating enzyme